MCPALHFTVHMYHLQKIVDLPCIQRNTALCTRTTYRKLWTSLTMPSVLYSTMHVSLTVCEHKVLALLRNNTCTYISRAKVMLLQSLT